MSEDKHKGERIAKIMARAGVCSRRDAEKWITSGRVKVNGKVIDSPALNVTENDKVLVDNKPLPETEQTRLFLYHKPAGLVTSHKDEQGRATVFDSMPDFMPRVVSVGRLDLNTEGLLLLTNDGELSRFLELPATGWKRKYRVRVHGKVNEKRLASLKNGITVEGVRYKSIIAVLDKQKEGEQVNEQGTNSWISVTISEGKNREIRRVMEALGLRVTRLIRTDYGPFSLGKMPRGSVSEVPENVMHAQIEKFFATKPPMPEKKVGGAGKDKPKQKFERKQDGKPRSSQKSKGSFDRKKSYEKNDDKAYKGKSIHSKGKASPGEKKSFNKDGKSFGKAGGKSSGKPQGRNSQNAKFNKGKPQKKK